MIVAGVPIAATLLNLGTFPGGNMCKMCLFVLKSEVVARRCSVQPVSDIFGGCRTCHSKVLLKFRNYSTDSGYPEKLRKCHCKTGKTFWTLLESLFKKSGKLKTCNFINIKLHWILRNFSDRLFLVFLIFMTGCFSKYKNTKDKVRFRNVFITTCERKKLKDIQSWYETLLN